MFSGNEWLILVVVAGAIAAFVYLLVRATRGTLSPPVSAALVHGAPGDVVRDLVLTVTGQRNTTVLNDGSRSLTIQRSYIPAWAIVIAILFFPLGLLALLARTTVSGTIWAEAAGDDRTQLRMGGVFSKQTIGAVNTMIGARS